MPRTAQRKPSLKMDFSTKTLAKGCFGKVYKQMYGDTWAAVKKVPMNFINKEQLNRELRVYEKAQHNNIVRLLGLPWLEEGNWHIPLEFIFGEDLETSIFYVQKSKVHLNPSVKATIITGMCEGLNFLHSKDIVHQDLKPDNIMIEHGSHRAVIIDMGLAKFFRNGLSSAVNLGNEAYASPEVLQGSVRDKRSDVWAMGKIIGELCVRVRLPTLGLSPIKIKETLRENPYCSVICRMVMMNTAERATMAGVIGEIRQIGANQAANGAGAGRPHVGLGIRGPGAADFGAKQKLRPPTAFPPEAKHHEIPAERIHRSPSPQPQAIVPVNPKPTADQFRQMNIPCPLPPDGTVIHQLYDNNTGQMEFKQIVTRHGKVVKYEDVKITK